MAWSNAASRSSTGAVSGCGALNRWRGLKFWNSNVKYGRKSHGRGWRPGSFAGSLSMPWLRTIGRVTRVDGWHSWRQPRRFVTDILNSVDGRLSINPLYLAPRYRNMVPVWTRRTSPSAVSLRHSFFQPSNLPAGTECCRCDKICPSPSGQILSGTGLCLAERPRGRYCALLQAQRSDSQESREGQHPVSRGCHATGSELFHYT